MTEIEISKSIFNEIYLPHLTNYARTQIFYGGSSSGKSVFLAQRCIYDILQGGRNYLICRAVARTIRRSVFNEIRKVITDWGLVHLFNINRSDGIITCLDNGQQILFSGLDDTEKVKSITPKQGVITDIWIEEATETDRNSVKQLYKRQRGGDPDTPKRLTLSFNPILQSHWIYDEHFKAVAWADDQTDYTGANLTILKTWYIHNKFLTAEDIADLENETDKYFRDVYTFGNWGVLGHIIFRNWEVRDLSEMRDQFTNHRNGLDFGFSDDPAAMAVTHYDRKHKTIYIYDELYEYGLQNDALAELIIDKIGIFDEDRDGKLNFAGTPPLKCDSAEPKSIKELQRYGINSIGAKKGKDSVRHGLQWLQQQTIIIDQSCVNAKNEIMQAQWKEDKNGNAIRGVPVEKNDHLVDSMRYAYEDDANEAYITTAKNPFYN